MPSLLDDSAIRVAFSVYGNKGVYALLLGSGLSRAAEIPTGWDITIDLIRRVAKVRGESDQTDWASWYRETMGSEPDYSKLLGDLASSQEERRSILHSYIEPTEKDLEVGRRLPTAAHCAIADLVRAKYIRVIITTNFDRLVENALKDRGIEPTVVSSVDALKGAEPIVHTKCLVLKLHGDYKDSRILNTDVELSKYPPEFDDQLDRIFDEHGLIVCGWSGEWDNALRLAMLRCPARRYSTFWTTKSHPGERAADLMAHRRAQLVRISDADSFFQQLRDDIFTLQETHRQNPQSVELLVSTTKRYLSNPEHRISLDELLSSEAEALIERLELADLSPRAKEDSDEFRRRVGIYESATEPLARILGVLGRWGDSSEYDGLVNIIRSVHSQVDRPSSGKTMWLNLQTYPAVLLVAAYGIGLVCSQRWATLHNLYSEHISSPFGEKPVRVVEKLFPWSWAGDVDTYWSNLEELNNGKFLFSFHLNELFFQWGKSFVGIVPDPEKPFETWEILGSIAYSERYTLEQLCESVMRESFEWAPVGLFGNYRDARERVLGLLQGEEFKRQLLEANFCFGRSALLEAAISNLVLVAKKAGRGF